jgi:hypothetical protein
MDVGAVSAGLVQFDEHVAGADFWNRPLFEPQARLRLFLDEGAMAPDPWP